MKINMININMHLSALTLELSFTTLSIITSPPEGVARYCFHPVCVSVCLSVCLSVSLCVCVCVSGQYFGILFLGYQKRYRSEIYAGYL